MAKKRSAKKARSQPSLRKQAPVKKPAAKKTASASSGAAEVDAYLQDLNHPLQAGIETIRATILGVSPAITEGIKWNSPSFRVQEWFATVNLRKGELLVILHLGAKVKDNTRQLVIDDPAGLLEWLAKDRAAVRFAGVQSVEAKRTDLAEIVRQWIQYLS